ncbi:cell wall-associated NlpC family hydrolase [Kitasatospora gansuensis]|uniref:Cell wall-associated NlpC family hydrolase n=1 Tax=Kitasatospora gansuensis TaxID=258050 RepID=A0A7W7SD73_9ACTN|nr:C40 family peptidase [Kitasatospora gansuensis]MBB4948122.1 cell wall-associated NlpC family hydrolase [Kitasatospora gansuensis]
MKIATDPALIGFADLTPTAGPCGCAHCLAVSRRLARARGAVGPGSADGGRIHRAVRATCVATTVLAGAGVIGLGLGATTANAMPAPSKQGWDGTKYWFKNANGEWRYTSYLSVYQARTAQGSTPPSAASTNSVGIQQGWDGSKYWFKNSSGEWRYTSHLSVYQARTGQSGGGTAPAPAPAPPTAPSTPASGSIESAIAFASAQLGKPYVWGGNGPSGFDCSGLVQQAYRRAGISLPRVADDQYAAGTPISSGQLRRGDLIFWSNSSRASGIHHVAIYLGDNKYLEAARPGTTIRISTLSKGYFPTHLARP